MKNTFIETSKEIGVVFLINLDITLIIGCLISMLR